MRNRRFYQCASGTASFETGAAALAATLASGLLVVPVIGVAGDPAGAAGRASEVSILLGAPDMVASTAITLLDMTNSVARTAVALVRKSAAPRALISPDGLPPMPSPPPSERCIRMTETSAAAI